jgi:uncharacterized protein GlcG (DUF336 family)
MTARIACCVSLTLGLSMANAATAQAPKLTIPLTSLQTGAALTAAQAAFARCQKDGYTVAVAVVDRSGYALALLRDPLAGAHTAPTALGKASTAVSFRIDTTELARETQAGRPQSGIRELPGIVAAGGGMPIRAKGALVGGIGVSGAPGGDADDACAKAGIAAISDALELE